jgi:hypothetical protein
VRTVIVATLLLGLSIAMSGQRSNAWPIDTPGAGGFSVKRLAVAPSVDGRLWIEADVKAGEPASWRPAKADYTLRLTDFEDIGDFSRGALIFERLGARPVSLSDAGKTGYAYVTPDARFIFMEPLIVVDVRRWRRYALYSALGIEPYLDIRAISHDGRHLLISHHECPYDCPNDPITYLELTLPS